MNVLWLVDNDDDETHISVPVYYSLFYRLGWSREELEVSIFPHNDGSNSLKCAEFLEYSSDITICLLIDSNGYLTRVASFESCHITTPALSAIDQMSTLFVV